MAVLKPHDRLVMYANPSKTTATMAEIKEFTNEGIEGGGLTEAEVDAKIKAETDKLPTKAQMDAAIKVVEDDANAMELDIGVLKTANTANTAAVAKLQTDKADKTSLNKAGVGLGNVDNTSDVNKPVSTAQKTALDKKVDLVGLHKTYNKTLPIPFTAVNVDVNTIDYGESYIQTNTAINAPPNTAATLIQKIITHSAAQDEFPFVDIADSAWEQGTTASGGVVGKPREDILAEAGSALEPTRIRTKTLIPIDELGKLRLTGVGYNFHMTLFDENQLSIGREIFWSTGTVIAPAGARYAQIVVKKSNDTPITPESEFGKFKVATAKTDVIKGEGSVEIAWGATKGDLHTRVVIKNGTEVAYGPWNLIGSKVPDPSSLPDGTTLEVKNGRWSAVLPTTDGVRGA